MTGGRSASGSRGRRMTRAEGAALVEDWKRSGLGASAFAKARGVGVQRIKYWRRALEAEQDAFVVMSSEQLAAEEHVVGVAVRDSDKIEVAIGQHVVVRIPNTAANLAEVLRELGAVAS